MNYQLFDHVVNVIFSTLPILQQQFSCFLNWMTDFFSQKYQHPLQIRLLHRLMEIRHHRFLLEKVHLAEHPLVQLVVWIEIGEMFEAIIQPVPAKVIHFENAFLVDCLMLVFCCHHRAWLQQVLGFSIYDAQQHVLFHLQRMDPFGRIQLGFFLFLLVSLLES